MERSYFKKWILKSKELAALELTQEEEESFLEHLEKMQRLIEELKEINTQNVSMFIYPHEDIILNMEEDTPRDERRVDFKYVIKNAPESFKEFIKVKSPIKEIKVKE